MNYFSQAAHAVRFEWGVQGVEHLARDVECVVIIDVMSFSTCVNIATERGAIIFPYPWKDESATRYGEELGAEVASSKRRFAGGYSLSPTSLRGVPSGLKLVLPSPNGASAAYHAKDMGAAVYCGSLRNMRATARMCRQYSRVLVIACGERWPDNSLRPSLEDYIAAGGIIAAIASEGGGNLSPEAQTAALAFDGLGVEGRSAALNSCGSAIELTERGFAGDVALCLEEDVSSAACRLEDKRFVVVSGT
jgi:2-phosphosulfolactate phosphatase